MSDGTARATPAQVANGERVSARNLSPDRLRERFERVRAQTLALCDPLQIEDYNLQSMAEASPVKWHLAHTTWFFETFILQPVNSDYQVFHPDFRLLFNSYYAAVGRRLERGKRSLLSRPSVEEIRAYRMHVDQAILGLIDSPMLDAAIAERIVLGLHHEQQHQELILTDLKHALAWNPLRPVYRAREIDSTDSGGMQWRPFDAGVRTIGHHGDSFSFDNETPEHRVFVEAFSMGSRLVTNGDYLEFMEDGGYERESLWLSLGWEVARSDNWCAPLYWEKVDGNWWSFTLSGMRPVDRNEPVCHVSYFEADAFARWAGATLPSEAEWESVAQDFPVAGNFVESEAFHPTAFGETTDGVVQCFGDVWEWTRSAYDAYPGFQPAEGAIGEYNGKFMCNQMVLRGGSCATPADHVRASYRNFFPPEARWQFSGIRLVRA